MNEPNKEIERIVEAVDNFYSNRLAMHEGRGYVHSVIDKIEIRQALLSYRKTILEEVKKLIKDKSYQLDKELEDWLIATMEKCPENTREWKEKLIWGERNAISKLEFQLLELLPPPQ